MVSRRPDPHDVEVGRRLRACRVERQMSQLELATELGLTFQQVQKYERGRNRIGAGRLKRIAEILEVPITYFFAVNGEANDPAEPREDPRSARLLRAYARIVSPELQGALLELAENLAAAGNGLVLDPPNGGH
jgi:transcriptional regulator with XRE-family HTH domain